MTPLEQAARALLRLIAVPGDIRHLIDPSTEGTYNQRVLALEVALDAAPTVCFRCGAAPPKPAESGSPPPCPACGDVQFGQWECVSCGPGRDRQPRWCGIHQHYKWCGHNGGVMGKTGYEAPPQPTERSET
jgi:hypothetical protein